MRAADFAPVRPLNCEPQGTSITRSEAYAVLLDALRGTTLGAYDRTIASWSAVALDEPTLRVLVSWLERVRRAGQCEALEAVNEHLVAAGHHASAEIARGRAHDIRVGRWLLDDTRAGDRR